MARLTLLIVFLIGLIAGGIFSANYTVPPGRTTTVTVTRTVTSTGGPSGQIIGYCFSPGGGCDQTVVFWIGRANVSVHVLIYSFTLQDVADALIAAKNRGVDVKVVMEKENINGSGSMFSYLVSAGVDIRSDTNSNLMHDKFAVIDQHILLTGSFNWSSSAVSGNNENLVVLNDPTGAAGYEQQFQLVYGSANLP